MVVVFGCAKAGPLLTHLSEKQIRSTGKMAESSTGPRRRYLPVAHLCVKGPGRTRRERLPQAAPRRNFCALAEPKTRTPLLSGLLQLPAQKGLEVMLRPLNALLTQPACGIYSQQVLIDAQPNARMLTGGRPAVHSGRRACPEHRSPRTYGAARAQQDGT